MLEINLTIRIIMNALESHTHRHELFFTSYTVTISDIPIDSTRAWRIMTFSEVYVFDFSYPLF